MVRMLVILMVMVRANLSTWSSAAHVGFALLVRCPNQKFSESQNLLSKKYKLRMPSSFLNPTESDKMKKNDLPRQIWYQNRKGKPFMFWVAFLEKLCDLLSKECKLQKPSTPVNPTEAHRIWYLIRAGMRSIFWVVILTYRTSRKHWNSAETPLRHLWDTAETPFVDDDNGDGDVDDYVDVGDWWWQWRWR